jgi:PAS domain S-box-containing protein
LVFSRLSLIEPAPPDFLFRPRLNREDIWGRIFVLLAPSRSAGEAAVAAYADNSAGIIVTPGQTALWHACGPLLYHLVVPDLNSPSLAEQLRPHLELLQRLFQSEKKLQAAGRNPRPFQAAAREIGPLFPAGGRGAGAEYFRLAQDLLSTSATLRIIFEASQAGIILVDARGIITLANQSMSALFGCPLAKLIGSTYPSFLHPQEKTIGDHLMHQLIRGEIDHVSTERHYLRADGGDFWGHLSGKRLVTPEGEFQGLVGIIADISDRRRAEEARSKMLTFVETLLAQSPLAIRVFDGESGACLQANKAAADNAGGSIEALLQQNFRQLKSWRDAGLDCLAEEILAGGGVRQVEAQLLTSFGKQEIVEYFISRFEVDGHPHLLVLGQDITEKKRLDAENKRISEQFLQAQKLESLGVLAGGIAHDFNNILLSISGNADLALRNLGHDSPAAVNLKRIKNATDKAAELARQMLAYSGKGKFLVETLDLNHLLEEMLHILEISISKKVLLHLNLQRPLPCIDADATQLRQIVMNLVINAAEAIGDRSGEIFISTSLVDYGEHDPPLVGAEQHLSFGRYLCLAVTDTGCGMDAQTRAKLFEPFFTTKFTGRGLGMAAVQGIIRGHRGAIQVCSEPGQGSTFQVLLPVTDKPVQPATFLEEQEEWRGTGKILLVDDEEAVRNIATEMLQELGFSVLSAGDGAEALRVFAGNPDIDCVILDLTMPQMDGRHCFQELRRLNPAVKVILISGYSEQEIDLKLDNDELAGFLQKPFWLSSLREALLRLFNAVP